MKSRIKEWQILCSIFLVTAGAMDAGLTTHGIQTQRITEGNPLMAWFYDQSPLLFFFWKLLLPMLLLIILLQVELKNRWVRRLLYLTCVLYFGIMLMHMNWLYHAYH